jgi:hypothetical protein
MLKLLNMNILKIQKHLYSWYNNTELYMYSHTSIIKCLYGSVLFGLLMCGIDVLKR